MDCKYMVTVIPPIIERDGGIYWSLGTLRSWLTENGIKRYRGGEWPREVDHYHGDDITFRFELREDAMAFKLAWG